MLLKKEAGMPRSIPVILPSKTFSKKSDAVAFFSKMLNNYEDGQKVKHEDDKILFELLQRHPEDKIREGVEYFYRDKAQDYPTSCFHIKRLTGEPTDFSIKDCVDAKEQTLDQLFYKACRSSILQILTDKKNELFNNGVVHCSLSGEVLSKDQAVYKHTSPRFRDIVERFKKKYSITITREMFVDNEDMQYITEFSDVCLKDNFVELHQEIANLAIFKK